MCTEKIYAYEERKKMRDRTKMRLLIKELFAQKKTSHIKCVGCKMSHAALGKSCAYFQN